MSILNQHKSAVRDFFLYLLMGGTFYFVLFDFEFLLFSYIDELLPDAAQFGYSNFADTIRFQLSSLIVLFPVYVGVACFLRKDLNKNPEKVDFPLRKFFVYLTLFLATISLIGDMIALINGYLNGELTLRFLLKVFAVFATAIGVGSYFWYEIKRGPASPPSKSIAGVVSLLVIAMIVCGLILAGSPSTQRKYRLDNQRVGNITLIVNEINMFWRSSGKIPVDLKDLSTKSTYDLPNDPETKQPYEYVVTGDKKYKLCATFTLESDISRGGYENGNTFSTIYYDYEAKTWRHPAGYYCYEFEIKDRYPLDQDKTMESVPLNAPLQSAPPGFKPRGEMAPQSPQSPQPSQPVPAQ